MAKYQIEMSGIFEGDLEVTEIIEDPCEGVVCDDYCDGTTRYYNGHCVDGVCVYDIEENSTACGFVQCPEHCVGTTRYFNGVLVNGVCEYDIVENSELCGYVDPCEGVTCEDYCDGTTRYYDGHCVGGECVYDSMEENSTLCGYVPPEYLVEFHGDSAGWHHTPGNVSFHDDRMYWNNMVRNQAGYAYKQVAGIPADYEIEYTFMKTQDSFKGCTVAGILTDAFGEHVHDMPDVAGTHEIYGGYNDEHSACAVARTNNELPIREGAPVYIDLNVQYWVKSIVENGLMTTTVYLDAARTNVKGVTSINVPQVNNTYVYMIASWGDSGHTDTQSGWMTDFTLKALGSSPDPCEGVVCNDYCDGTTRYYNGHCVNGQCVYDIEENSSECDQPLNWTGPVSIDQDKRIIVGGQKVFPQIMYFMCAYDESQADCLNALETNDGYDIDLLTYANFRIPDHHTVPKKYITMVNGPTYPDDPYCFGYIFGDEVYTHGHMTIPQMIATYQATKAADPNHVVLTVDWKDLYLLQDTCDILFNDLYTWREWCINLVGRENIIYMIDQNTKSHILGNLPDYDSFHTPIIQVLSALATPDEVGTQVKSTLEQRAAIYDAITTNVDGIGYYTYAWSPYDDCLCNDPVLAAENNLLGKEVQSLNNILVLPTKDYDCGFRTGSQVTFDKGYTFSIYGHAYKNFNYMLKQDGNIHYLIVLNKDPRALSNVAINVAGLTGNMTVTMLGNRTSGSAQVGRTISMNNGTFTDSFDGITAHIYKIEGGTADPCEGVTCPDYCDGTTRYHSGYCVNGTCNYTIEENSTICGYVPPEPPAGVPEFVGPMTINSDKTCNVNGRKVFPVGMWYIANTTIDNTNTGPEKNQEFLYSMGGLYSGDLLNHNTLAKFEEYKIGYTMRWSTGLPSSITNSPSMGGWVIVDEPAAGTHGSVLSTYNTIKASGTPHPVIMNHYQDLGQWHDCGDINSWDNYPIDGRYGIARANKMFFWQWSSWNWYMKSMGSNGIYDCPTPVHAVLQGNGKPCGIFQVPTPAEIRLQTYIAVTMDIDGINWWGYSCYDGAFTYPDSPGCIYNTTVHNAIKKAAGELMDLNDVLVLPTKDCSWFGHSVYQGSKSNDEVTFSNNPVVSVYATFGTVNHQSLNYMLKQDGNTYYLIVANVSPYAVDTTININGVAGMMIAETLGTETTGSAAVGRTISVTNGSFVDHFDGAVAHIYKIE